MGRSKITITIDKDILEELEEERKVKIGEREIIEDRSRLIEKLLILGLAEHKKNNERLKVLERLRLEKLNIEKIDFKKILP